MVKIFRKMTLVLFLAYSVTFGGLSPSLGQSFPDRPITLIVPFAAGGSTDLVARVVATKMSSDFGKQVVVENVGGAGGSLGAERVARAKPDGYTILMGTVATHALNPLMPRRISRRSRCWRSFRTCWSSTRNCRSRMSLS